MAISYFELSPAEQSDLLGVAEDQSGRTRSVIEKDIWVCMVLQALFSMPCRKAMAFKGGTSLSKVHSIIQRFSEDIDITIDYRELGCDLSVTELARLSRGQRGRLGDALKEQVRAYTKEAVQPHLHDRLQALGCGAECPVTVNDDGEKLFVGYPSRVAKPGQYLRDHVLLEFGGRNLIDPNATHMIMPDVASLFPEVIFPTAEAVVVLAAERTFWEKVTLVHDHCNRTFPGGRDRLSRHWYDLAMLARHVTGQRAMADLDLLRDVIDLKNVFYKRASSHYDRCLTGELNLIPGGENLQLLERDYAEMNHAGMLNGHVYPLEQILAELTALQEQINKLAVARATFIV